VGKAPSNENIHIGDIFKHTSRDECGSSCGFCQVVGKRGKTLVELRPIRGERFVDESCNLGLGQVKVRPLPGQFFEGDVFTVRALDPSDIDGRNWLAGRGEYSWMCCSEVREGEMGRFSGYDGFYALDEMKKESGKWFYEVPGPYEIKTIPRLGPVNF